MASIQSLGISGIRGYTPENYQKIQFKKPLTLIYGKNGSGKTTIIQCLKYITTGSLPPNSDKGKSFVMDPKIAGRPEVIGDVRLIFTVGNRQMLAKRRISVSSSGPKGNMKFQSIEQMLKTKGENGEYLTINHQCAQIEKQIPHFLGISKPILENIVFCHQDDSLWPFGDSNILKNIFDDLFETKQFSNLMDDFWECKKFQEGQLKQQKVRLEYQRMNFHRQLQQEQKLYKELEQLQAQSQSLPSIRKQLKQLKHSLKDNQQLIKQRQKLIHKKGIVEGSIANLQSIIKKCKINWLEAQRNFQQKSKMNNIPQMQIEYPENNITHDKFSQKMIGQVRIQFLNDIKSAHEYLLDQRVIYQELIKRYNETKERINFLTTFAELSKCQRQIKSQIQRINDILPELKNKHFRNEQEVLSVLKQKCDEMGRLVSGIQISRAKLKSLTVPNLVDLGMHDKEIQEYKKQYKRLKVEIQEESLVIMKIYKAKFKSLPLKIDLSLAVIKAGERAQSQLLNLTAVLQSKQQQLEHYQTLPRNFKSSAQQLNHLKYLGINLQDEMLEYCKNKKKCYFCQKAMNPKQITTAQDKVTVIKNKTKDRIQQVQKVNDSLGVKIDPDIMIKKIRVQLKQLTEKKTILQSKASQYKQIKKWQGQSQINQVLQKQLKRCSINIQVLSNMVKQGYDGQISLDNFKQMSAGYQIKLARYQTLKQQLGQVEATQTRNQQLMARREEVLKQRVQIQQAIREAQQKTRNLDFIRNSYQKLQKLIRMKIKSSKKKISQHDDEGDENYRGNFAQISSLNTVQQAQQEGNRVFGQIQKQKFLVEKLQVQIEYSTKFQLKKLQNEALHKLSQDLAALTATLATTQITLDRFNELHHFYDKQSERISARIKIISTILNEYQQKQYLKTIYQIKQLQESINNLEMVYHSLELAISKYHSEKMAEINQYIYETWREIYHGDDIQFIEIESMAQNDKKNRKKNYSYRILMKKMTKGFKNQQKVEMKGRCSMGQKVLASIVIRLALAQVFCSRATILALDQPTTNLDKQHIQNLAHSLLRLIELSGGKNLELIIISHDIQFIKLLESFSSTYYEISRDENKFSRIDEKEIKGLFAEKMFLPS